MENVKDFCFEKVMAGNSISIPNFYDTIIKQQFTNIDTIKKTHDALMSYLNMDNKTFFLRLYGSYPKDKYDLLRRGFLTEYPCKTKISFCDNTFSMLFTGLKLANIPLTNLKLADYLSQKSLITSFGVTSKEKELSYYTSKNALRIDLNSKGWYLAHIKPVGYGYMDLDLKSLFPNPPRHEWNTDSKVRISQTNLSEDQNRIIKAHFLRFIHPLNSFLLPKRNLINYEGSNLGEEIELISYVSEKIKIIFKDQYDEFDTISMKYDFQPSNTNISNIEWVDFSKKNNNKNELVNDNLSTMLFTEKNKKNNPIKANTMKKEEAFKPIELKIGKYVQSTFRKAISKIHANELGNLQLAPYSKTTFDIQYPLLKRVLLSDTERPNRYWKEPVEILGDKYWLCSEWYEKEGNNDRPYYEKWLNKIMLK